MNCWLCKKHFDGEPVWTNVRMLCPECAEKPRHRYYYLNRSPGIGCQPNGFMDREGWMPAKALSLPRRPTCRTFGWADYPEPLDPEQVWKWELTPANDEEYEQFEAWRKEHGR